MDVSALLVRALHEVFGENDPQRRLKAIDEIFREDAVFREHKTGTFRGRTAIDGIVGAFRAAHPDLRYQVVGGPEVIGDGGRVRWLSGRRGEPPVYAGTDFIIAKEGRIAALYLFFDQLPP